MPFLMFSDSMASSRVKINCFLTCNQLCKCNGSVSASVRRLIVFFLIRFRSSFLLIMRLTVDWETFVRRAISFWTSELSLSVNYLILLTIVEFPLFGDFRFLGNGPRARFCGVDSATSFSTWEIMRSETSTLDFERSFLVIKREKFELQELKFDLLLQE